MTAWVDASALYGSDEETTRRLRAHRDGAMKTHLRVENPSLPTRGQCGFSSPPPQHSGVRVENIDGVLVLGTIGHCNDTLALKVNDDGDTSDGDINIDGKTITK